MWYAAPAIVGALPPGHSELADQLRRTSTSIPLNIAEGAGEHSRADKARFYRIARDSATESAAIIDVVRRLGACAPESYAPAREMLVRIVSMLVKMVRLLRD